MTELRNRHWQKQSEIPFDPLLEVEVPAGASSGMEVTFHGPDGKAHIATVPEGLKPGDVFHVELAD